MALCVGVGSLILFEIEDIYWDESFAYAGDVLTHVVWPWDGKNDNFAILSSEFNGHSMWFYVTLKNLE